MAESLFTVREAACFLKVSAATIYRLCAVRDIRYFKIRGGMIRIKREDLDKYLGGAAVRAQVREVLLPARVVGVDIDDRAIRKGGPTTMGGGRKVWRYGFGRIYERRTKAGVARFVICHPDRAGKWVQRVVREAVGHKDALAELMRVTRENFDARNGIKGRKQASFCEFADLYLEKYSKTNLRSWRVDKSRARFLKEFFAAEDLEEVTAERAEDLKRALLAKGRARSSVNRYLALLRRMFTLAVDWGYAASRPRFQLFSERDNFRERILTEEEELRLLSACPAYLADIVDIALNTGMRRGEILGLRWENVDLKRKTITLTRTKSDRRREIPMNSIVRIALEGIKERGRSPWVFPNPETGRPLTDVKKSFRAACKAAGVEGLRFHDLRHTFATRLIEECDIVTLKELLGHSSVTVTERYAHSSLDRKTTAVGALERKARSVYICSPDETGANAEAESGPKSAA
ncbi:MAG: tyrosine-type recombinase/integrase [Candidatus Aminicenantes bacterium]|nr:tyrosine-type recombinase/integrase [Candidatus Aminicenantes bacterium]